MMEETFLSGSSLWWPYSLFLAFLKPPLKCQILAKKFAEVHLFSSKVRSLCVKGTSNSCSQLLDVILTNGLHQPPAPYSNNYKTNLLKATRGLSGLERSNSLLPAILKIRIYSKDAKSFILND